MIECECTDWTMVGHPREAYHPSWYDGSAYPQDHHPDCPRKVIATNCAGCGKIMHLCKEIAECIVYCDDCPFPNDPCETCGKPECDGECCNCEYCVRRRAGT